MLELIWFREQVRDPANFEGAKPDPRGADYEGYAGAFAAVARELGVDGIEVVFRGSRAAGLVAGPEDGWDDILIVRHRSFADLRTVLHSEPYQRLANPHRLAGVANRRFVATRAA